MADVVLRGPVPVPRRPGGLPAQAASFVGRSAELTGIAALLGTARMVTVTGAPGVGKTRVSLRAAATVAEWFPDGTWLADLAPVSDPALLAGAVAAVLGRPQVGARGLLASLRGKRMLLILDTCEHLLDACAEFADELLRSAPGVTVLATSRQPLDTQGEHAFPVLPLPAESDAADLFAQRAAAALPGFTVTERNRPDVVRLGRLLDGNPLAIELAAVRLRALPLPELASQLASGMGTLGLSRRGAIPRHQTLRACVQWSYDQCTQAERLVWQRLSVFPGSFDAAGAEQVCAGASVDGEPVIDTLIGLVDKSVVRREDAAGRYLLPGAPREFGAELRAAREALGEPRHPAAAGPGSQPHGQRPGHPADSERADAPAAAAPAAAGLDAAGPAAAGPAAGLTRREREIAGLVAAGLSNREIAGRLFISKRTVDAHVEHIFGKLGISSRVQLTMLVGGPGQAPLQRGVSTATR